MIIEVNTFNEIHNMKYLRLIEIYRNLIVCCEALGFNVHRTDDGKHSISTNFNQPID